MPLNTRTRVEVRMLEAKSDLDTDFAASAKRIEELRAGRSLGDIAVGDEYWIALRRHQAAYAQKS